MPHLFVNRSRLHNLTIDRADLRAQFRWETINAVLYIIGGMGFIVGSVFSSLTSGGSKPEPGVLSLVAYCSFSLHASTSFKSSSLIRSLHFS